MEFSIVGRKDVYMIHVISNIRRTSHVMFLFIIIAFAFILNLYVEMFLGGLLLVSATIGGIVLNRKCFILLLLLVSFNFIFFSWYNHHSIKVIFAQGLVFSISLILAIFLSQEVKSYVDELNHQKDENSILTKELTMSFIEAIDAKDRYLQNHSHNVYLYAIKIGTKLSFSQERIKNLGLAAIFHDIGKLSVTAEILNKPSQLSETEWDVMKKHATNGPDILKNVTKLQSILPIIKYHHRFYNGLGYPDDLPNEKIPFESRIIAVADAFDAMTSNRPYRKALTQEEAYDELVKNSGSQFDPIVVDAFLKAEIRIIPHTSNRLELPELFI